MDKGALNTAERNRLIKLLNDVGLDDSEAVVYMAALGVGSRPASVIAQKAKLKRGQTYNVLGSLTEKGIVQQVEKNGVKHYSCSSPKALIGMLEARERELAEKRLQLERAIPELEKLVNPNIHQPRVRYYQGFEGLKAVYEGILEHNVDYIKAITGFPSSWMEAREERISFAQSFVRKRETLGIAWYGIVFPTAEMERQKVAAPSSTRKMKSLTVDKPPDSEIWIFGDSVAFTSQTNELVSVVIENSPMAKLVETIFDSLWKTLPDF